MAHRVRRSTRGNRYGAGAHLQCGGESVLDIVLANLAGAPGEQADVEPRRCTWIWPAAPLALRAEVRHGARTRARR